MFIPLSKNKSIIFAVLLIVIYAPKSFSEEDYDVMIYHFPNPYPTKLTNEIIPILNISQNITKDTDALQQGQYLNNAQYNSYKLSLNNIVNTTSNNSIKTDAKRRLILLEWASGKIDGVKTAKQLEELAKDTTLSPNDIGFTLAYSMVIYSRLYDIDQMQILFDEINPQNVPQFGWFAFEIVKYYSRYVDSASSKEEKESGNLNREEYNRMLKYADFLEKKFFPALEVYKKNNRDLLPLEKSQYALIFNNTADSIRRYLANRIYMDISKRSTEILFPKLFQLWGQALNDISAEDNYLDKKFLEVNFKKYKEEYVPQIKLLQKQKEFLNDFGKEMIDTQKVIEENVEKELIVKDTKQTDFTLTQENKVTEVNSLAPQKSDNIAPQNGLTILKQNESQKKVLLFAFSGISISFLLILSYVFIRNRYLKKGNV